MLFSLYGRSGMIHYASQLANALAKKHDVTVLLPSYTDKGFFDKGIKLIRMDAPTSVAKTAFLSCHPWRFKRAIAQVRKAKPDVIHVLDNHPWYLLLLPWLKDIPLVVTQHDVTAHPGEFIRGKITIAVNRYLSRRAKRIVVHGEKLKKMIIQRGVPAQKVHVLPHGDYAFFLRWARKGIKEEPATILCFGRILHYKGLDILLEATKKLRTDFPQIKVLVAGEGDLERYRAQLDELKENVEIKDGFIAERDVAPLFQRAGIIVLPYREASQSGVVPIAWAFKKAVIVTDVGSLAEIVEHGTSGLVVPPESPSAIATAIRGLLTDAKKRKALGQGGYRRMRAELDWGKIATQASKLYREVR